MKKFSYTLAICTVLLANSFNAAFATSDSYNIKTETSLNEALTSTEVDDKTFHVNSNINLLENLSAPYGSTLRIYGNDKTIDGAAKAGFSTPYEMDTIIRNLTLQNFSSGNGGAFYNGGTTSVYNSTFSGNSAESGYGGAIYTLYDLNIYDSTFTNNTAADGYEGGAIYGETTININNSTFSGNTAGYGGAITSYDTLYIYNSTFKGNTVSNFGYGGAIYNDYDSSIYNTTFGGDTLADGNSAYSGGAICNYGTMYIHNSNFLNNTADEYGGAIDNEGSLYVYDSTFAKNHETGAANLLGGALYNYSTANIYDSTFGGDDIADGNTAYAGGAIYNENWSSLYLTADKNDIIFKNNSASDSGGAIYNNSGYVYLIANNCGVNFSSNTADTGNDIYNTGSIYMNAGMGDIKFNSGIYSTGSIYVNSDYNYDINNDESDEAAPTMGRVVLNSALTGNGNVEIDNGTFKIGPGGSVGVSAGDSLNNITFGNGNWTSPILDMANGQATDNTYSTYMTISSNVSTSIWMDIDMTTAVADKLNVSNTLYLDGDLNLKTFRLLNDAPAAIVTVADVGTTSGFGNFYTASQTYTNNYIYSVSVMGSGVLSFVQSDTTDGLADAIADIPGDDERSFSLTGNYLSTPVKNLTSSTLSSGTLTIFGNGTQEGAYSISGGDDVVDADNYNLFYIDGGTLRIVDAVVKNAYYDGDGAAAYNYGTLNIFDSLISNNIATGYGGAIYNAGDLYVTGSTFANNASQYGGAICLENSAYIYNSTFTGNSATGGYGGAIDNESSELYIANSTFGGAVSDANTAFLGGAIANFGSSYIYNSTFQNNIAQGGGAIYNSNGGTTDIYNSNFVENNVNVLGTRYGGAIYNESGTVNVYNSTFTKNSAPIGGAIANFGDINIYNSTFGGDTVADSNISNYGCAIYNAEGSVYVYDSTFKNNSTTNKGGAIFSDGGDIVLVANEKNVEFTGNTATAGGNDIYLANGANLFLNADIGKKVIINGGIESSSINDGNIYINNGEIGEPTPGETVLNAPIQNSSVYFYNGTLSLGNDTNLNGNVLNLAGGVLNMQNSAAGTMALNSLQVSGTTNLKIDADLANSRTDKITGTYMADAGSLNISSIKLLSDSTTNSTTTSFLGSDLTGHNLVTLGVTKAYTPIYQYDITYDDTTGSLIFAGGPSGGSGGFNPAVLSSPVSASTGAYLSQVSVNNEALSRSDLFMSLPQSERTSIRLRNKYAFMDNGQVFSPTFMPDEKGGLWAKQYTSFENVPLSNGPNVSNVGYGVIVGGDTPLQDLGNGYDGFVTAYAAYNGSHQNYDNVGVNQNGGALGLTGTVYKGNFFAALTASVGESAGQANTIYGVDNFNTLLAGAALKLGYNFEMMRGKLIFQPTFLTAYTFANTFEYTTASGVNVTSNPMHAIQLAPGVKLIANLKNGWQPYLATNMVFNLMDKQKFYADNAELPQMSIDPYVEYGVGLQRRWGERFTGFGQAMFRGGGRNGLVLQFGFRIAIGK